MLISVRPLSFPGTRGSATRPAGHGDDGAVPPDEAGGQAESVQPADRALAAQDRRGAGDVGADAARGGDADGAPAGPGGPAGDRVDDVMQPRIAAPPGAAERTRRGQAAVADHDDLAGPDAGGAGVEAGVVGDADRPPAVRRIPRHPEVAAQ